MIGLLQRVTRAEVTVASTTVGAIGHGLLVLVGIEREDTDANAARLAERLTAYRVFPDAAGRMNRSVLDVGGQILLVPQFTLVADTRRGNRASFSRAGDPAQAATLFDALTGAVTARGVAPATGRFGADMQVALVNDGPVTFWLEA